ncbi:uncharacterized protein LOC122817790 [Drosophila biarmipes]|uniref:uncharacterized protein LOC122817790 n=1 Tax=Drosophila biarmipes TaxID=125945 RepID=UPI001CDAD0A0|nr:uncharacterized protein LOC122817790 [Drosophila biarmipes]
MSKKRRQAPKPYWNRMFQRYSQLIRHSQYEKPSWQRLLLLENLRKALGDFRSRGPLPTQKCQPVWTSRKGHISSRTQTRRLYLPNIKNVSKITELEDRKSFSSNYIWSSGSVILRTRKKTRVKSWKLRKVLQLSKNNTFLLMKRKSLKLRKNPYKISSGALHYKASPRIHYLAKPKKRQKRMEFAKVPRKKSSRKVSSKRLRNLAKPKLREDTSIRKNPYQIPGRALRAKITSRVQELAIPKISTQREMTGTWRLSEEQLRHFQIPAVNRLTEDQFRYLQIPDINRFMDFH